MALKAALTKDEYAKLPAGLKDLYKEDKGKFVLEVEGMTPDDTVEEINGKLAEFRDNNIKLMKENGDIKKQFEGVDPDEFKTLKAHADANKGSKRPDEIAAMIANEVQKATGPLEDRTKKLEQERDEARTRLQQKQDEDELWEIGAKSGVAEWARTDFIRRGRDLFRRDEKGKLVATNGDAPLYSKRKNGRTEPLSLEEWATEWLPRDAPGFFKESKGSGARPAGERGQGGSRLVANDPLAIGENLDAIAKGEAFVAGVA